MYFGISAAMPSRQESATLAAPMGDVLGPADKIRNTAETCEEAHDGGPSVGGVADDVADRGDVALAADGAVDRGRTAVEGMKGHGRVVLWCVLLLLLLLLHGLAGRRHGHHGEGLGGGLGQTAVWRHGDGLGRPRMRRWPHVPVRLLLIHVVRL